MAEYIVDCAEVPHDSGVLVLPISINGHVHEQLIRCKDCRYCRRLAFQGDVRYECGLNTYSRHFTELDGFCHRAVPRGGDG